MARSATRWIAQRVLLDRRNSSGRSQPPFRPAVSRIQAPPAFLRAPGCPSTCIDRPNVAGRIDARLLVAYLILNLARLLDLSLADGELLFHHLLLPYAHLLLHEGHPDLLAFLQVAD